MEWWTRFDEIYSNEGVHVKSIVSLNLFDPLILTNAKMPTYVCNDATHHYISFTGRSSTDNV